jgi:arginyl-tRNA synthetase
MYTIQKAKQQILTELKHAVGSGFSPNIGDLEAPPDSNLGDVAFPCFSLSKKLKKSPNEIAVELAAKIGPKEYIAKIKADGPYVNFIFDNDFFGSAVLGEVKEMKEKYGRSNIGEGKRVMVEFANLNTHKDIHVGHLRNIFIGQMSVEILKANGYDTVPVAYINDLGAHVAKSVWAIQSFHKDEEVPKEKRVEFLRDVYVEANKKIEEDEANNEAVSKVFKNLEEQKGDDVAVWKKTRKWSIDFLESVYDELNLTIDTWYFESEVVAKTKKVIDEMIEKGIVVQSEGAWIVDLEEEKLGVNLLVKSDGTLLYNAKDIGLALKKEKDYHPKKSIYVVDARQGHALKQLFATMKRIDFDKDLSHLSYEFVTLKGGAMASRKGNVIRYEEFRDEVIAQATKETAKRHSDWAEKKIEKVSRAVSFAAIRFGMLRQDNDKKIIFDMDEAVSFEGFTGPYLLYTYARIQSLLDKAGKKKLSFKTNKLVENVEHRLMVLVSEFPEVLFGVSEDLQLSRVSQYLFELTRAFSEFYGEVQILKAEGAVSEQRLGLCKTVQSVLQNGLNLMGVETIKEM